MMRYTLLTNFDYALPQFIIYSEEECNKLIKFISPIEERAKKYAKDKYITEYVQNNNDLSETEFAKVFRAIDTLEDDAVILQLKEYTDEIVRTLEKITPDILNNYHSPCETAITTT
jgi:hypothetical protein